MLMLMSWGGRVKTYKNAIKMAQIALFHPTIREVCKRTNTRAEASYIWATMRRLKYNVNERINKGE